ncbi:MAG: DUF5723 family protein [Schleiferiaceae bacterium]|nr:DUF5723 family protein [Schleiferiaceae bacterium]
MKRVLLYSCCWLLSVYNATAQVDLNLYHFNAIGQSVLLNPATPQNRSLVIGLPGASQVFTEVNSGVGSVDMYFLSSSPTGNGLIENYLNENKTSSAVVARHRTDPLFLAFQTGRLHWSGGMSVRANVFSRMPYNLIDLAYNGNASGNGRNDVDIGNFGTEAIAFISYHGGVQLELIKERIFIGGRVSYLNGLGTARVVRSSARLQSNIDGFQLTTDGLAQLAYIDYESRLDAAADFNNLFDPNFYTTNNTGWAYDLGVHVNVTKKIAVSASITDMGSINWVDNGTVYRSSGTFAFEGINITYTDEGSINTQQFIDSLLSIIEYTESAESFSARLPYNLFLGSKIQLSKRHAVAGLLHRQQLENFGLNSFMLQYYGHIYNGLQLMGSYRISDETDLLSGVFSAGFSLRTLRTFQLFLLVNNVNALLDPYAEQSVGLNVGFNLAFNPKKKDKKPKDVLDEATNTQRSRVGSDRRRNR